MSALARGTLGSLACIRKSSAGRQWVVINYEDLLTIAVTTGGFHGGRYLVSLRGASDEKDAKLVHVTARSLDT